MTNRWLRLLLVVLAIGGSVGLGYRAWLDEQARADDSGRARAEEEHAEQALVRIGDLRAALHAYVAAGQGQAFWTARAGALIDELRTAVLSMDAAAAAADRSLTTSLDAIDQVAAAERRAREYVRTGQSLMAGDVIFTEARDLLDTVQAEVLDVAGAVQAAAHARQAALVQEQFMLAGGALVVWLLVGLILVPVPAATATAADDRVAATESPEEYARVIPEAPRAAAAPAVDLPAAAALCADLARVSEAAALTGLLERTAGVLDASGVIVWMADPAGATLFPVASHGYDPRLLSRIGSIPRDADNMTADAFRGAVTCTMTAQAGAPAAMAVPLVGPTGAIGVLSAEVPRSDTVGDHRTAVASIVAAQLATLVGSMPAAAPAAQTDPAEPAPEAAAEAETPAAEGGAEPETSAQQAQG
ncbi:MAG: GAF domain-containing protein [Vicinamibacterales bacterium]